MANEPREPRPSGRRARARETRAADTGGRRDDAAERARDDARVDEASEESFPASDPPSFMGAGRPGGPPR